METFIVQPQNLDQRNALEAFFKKLNIAFQTEERESLYNEEFLAKMARGDEDVEAGRTTTVTLDDIWK